MFRMLAPDSNVVLLTTFDADTQKLFPALVAKARAPTLENVRTVTSDLAPRIRAAAARGPVDFYFVFAGHGDIDKGKGFLELSDAPFTSDDLESLLKTVAATRSHVILDSCNSFFVINSRKPGGRHFVTSEEASKSLSQRLPNVGVFLSTSAEAEVFEWSELQSGVFSHAVRSGLSGAADVNGDGRVSYDELRAFVSVASMDIKNSSFRPQVFARGPGGRGGEALVDLTNATGTRVRLDDARRRLTLRDQNEVPWIDVHKEEGKELLLYVPTAVELAALPTGSGPMAARGPEDMFRRLFARPFGADAFAEFQASEPTSEPLVLGVSQDERERLRLVLKESADASRRARQVGGALTLPVGLGVGALGGVLIGVSHKIPGPDNGQQVAAAVMGGVLVAGGLYVSVRSVMDIVLPSAAERTYERFVQSLALAPDTKGAQMLYAQAEKQLFSAAVSDRRHRTWTRWTGLGLVAAGGGSLAFQLATSPRSLTAGAVAVYGVPMVFGGALFFESLFPTATERLAEVWKSDPAVARTRRTSGLEIKPMFGPLGAGVTGTF